MEEKEKEKLEGEIEDDEINILDYLIVLAKRKKMIIAITLTVSIITAVYSLFLPKIYKAEARILSSGKSDGRSGILEELSAIGISSKVSGLTDPSVIIGIIKSRTLYDRIIDRFGLMDIYETGSREVSQRRLASALMVDHERSSNIIKISVLDKDPQFAADITNAFVDELKKVLMNVALTDASGRRLFFEEQLKQAKEQLIKAEETLKEFQEETGVMKIDQTASLVMSSIANLRSQAASKEIELKVMRLYSTSNNPDLQITEEILKGLKDQLQKLEKKGENNSSPLIPTDRMPNVSVSYIRKLRDLKFNESRFEIMAKQYEMARLDEAKNSAIIQIIDKAVPPEERFKPNRTKMVILSVFTSFFLSLFIAFSLEFIQKLQADNNDNRERVKTLKRYLSFKG